jgi:hypothetical protein
MSLQSGTPLNTTAALIVARLGCSTGSLSTGDTTPPFSADCSNGMTTNSVRPLGTISCTEFNEFHDNNNVYYHILNSEYCIKRKRAEPQNTTKNERPLSATVLPSVVLHVKQARSTYSQTNAGNQCHLSELRNKHN